MSRGNWRGALRRGLAALCACSLAGCLLPATACPAAPEAAGTLDRSVRFLQDAQNFDGGFGGHKGGKSDPDFSAWAAYALAAAGINPQNQAQPGGVDVFTYLTAHTAGLRETTDFDRVALVALASGTSPRAFGAVDPVATILARQLADGSFPQQAGVKTGWVNSTIWSIFPLSAIGTPAADAAVQRAAGWLLAQQHPDGSWGSTGAASAADTDMVGAAIQALNVAGRHGTAAQAHAFEFLETQQGPDGGFRESAGGPTNSATTAWVVQGMWSAGVDPRAWRTETGRDPLSFLASLQRPDGSIGWTASDDLNSLWMTAQVGPALAGTFYPLLATALGVPPPVRPLPAQPPPVPSGELPRSSHKGQGGIGVLAAGGVIAGGGGRGASLFSAPQPQSGGSTPHGSRQLADSATKEPGPRPRELPSAAGRAGASGSAPPPSRGAAAGGAGSGTVEGVLVGDRIGAPAAPGLFGAGSGGRTDSGIVATLVAVLLAAIVCGWRREQAGAVRA